MPIKLMTYAGHTNVTDLAYLSDGVAFEAHGDGRLWLHLGSGNDSFLGVGSSSNHVFGGAGDDLLIGGTSDNSLEGGAGNDTLSAWKASDGWQILKGGDGDDLLIGPSLPAGVTQADLDRLDVYMSVSLNGGRGDDTYVIRSDVPNQHAQEERVWDNATRSYIQPDGHDRVNLTFRHDTSFALGQGIEDLFVTAMLPSLKQHPGGGSIYGNGLDNWIALGAAPVSDALTPFVNAGGGHDTVIGSEGRDRFHGSAGNDLLRGHGGNDHLSGDEGADTVDGGAGADTLFGGDGDDLYIVDNAGDVARDSYYEGGGSGTDHVHASVGTWTLHASLENLTYTGLGNFVGFGNASANVITGGIKADMLYGLAGNDSLAGGGGNDALHGGDGNDTLSGGAGNDILEGGAGNDRLVGGNGADMLRGGAGRDTLVGGEGGDRFVFSALGDSGTPAPDMIIGFETGRDRIELSALDADATLAGNQAFNFLGVLAANPLFSGAGDLWAVSTVGGVTLRGDVDGDGTAEFELLVLGSAAITGADLVL